MWRSLYRWLFRRRRVLEPEGHSFGYTSVVMPLLLAFIGVSAVELPIVHLIVPWTGLRIAFDIVGVYGLLWMVGLLAMLRVNPHVVSGAGLQVRSGTTVDMTIPWDYVAEVRALRHTVPARQVNFAIHHRHRTVGARHDLLEPREDLARELGPSGVDVQADLYACRRANLG